MLKHSSARHMVWGEKGEGRGGDSNLSGFPLKIRRIIKEQEWTTDHCDPVYCIDRDGSKCDPVRVTVIGGSVGIISSKQTDTSSVSTVSAKHVAKTSNTFFYLNFES